MNMRESALALNEYFTSLLASGFSREEALYLAGCVLSPVGPRPPKEQGDDK